MKSGKFGAKSYHKHKPAFYWTVDWLGISKYSWYIILSRDISYAMVLIEYHYVLRFGDGRGVLIVNCVKPIATSTVIASINVISRQLNGNIYILLFFLKILFKVLILKNEFKNWLLRHAFPITGAANLDITRLCKSKKRV